MVDVRSSASMPSVTAVVDLRATAAESDLGQVFHTMPGREDWPPQ